MKIKTIIVDDEPKAIEIIAGYLQRFSEIDVVATCSDGIQAFQLLQQKPIDLMFLDIKMPGLSGTDLLRSLKNPPKVIFTTAYAEYAVEGFDLDAVDYLVKPISFDRFLRAIDKVFKLHNGSSNITLKVEDPIAGKDVFLYLKIDRRMLKINTDDILWVESLKDYVKVVTVDKTFVSKQKISVLEEVLPDDRFIRIHRSYIVSISRISSYYSFSMEVDGKELPIGRNYKLDVQRKLKTSF